ncbi:MAG: TrkH family potassium uptake protein, partial [Desulfobacterales bacterium]|nr:TrkH family potassium uptake protein [Desulfobacterales bacterium]
MRWRPILNTVGTLILFFGLTMIIPVGFGLYYRDQSVIPLLKSMGITLIVGFILYKFFWGEKTEHLSQREGM